MRINVFKNFLLLGLSLIFLVSCEADLVEDNKTEAELVNFELNKSGEVNASESESLLETSTVKIVNAKNSFANCTLNLGYTLVKTDPYDSDMYGGYACIGDINCPYGGTNSTCLPWQLRRELIKEFGRHNTNITCLLKSTCPDSSIIASPSIAFWLASIGISIGGTGLIEEADANLIYREVICRILNEEGESSTSGQEDFIRINCIEIDYFLDDSSNDQVKSNEGQDMYLSFDYTIERVD